MASHASGLNPGATSWEPPASVSVSASRGRRGSSRFATRGAGTNRGRSAGPAGERGPERGPTQSRGGGNSESGRGPRRGLVRSRAQNRGGSARPSNAPALPAYQQRFNPQITPAAVAVAAPVPVPRSTQKQPADRVEVSNPSRGRPHRARAPRPPSPRPPPPTERAKRIYEDIDSGSLGCAICLMPILRTSPLWSCEVCHNVLHLACFAPWAAKMAGVPRAEDAGDGRDGLGDVRCPACNVHLVTTFDVHKHNCWCGRSRTFQPAPPAMAPNSCGRVCGRVRAGCEHTCPEPCHAGPCPPCTETVAMDELCYCGKKVSSRVCHGTVPYQRISCGAPCGAKLPCGVHRCARVCHKGGCGDCFTETATVCFCGKTRATKACKQQLPARWSANYGQVPRLDGDGGGDGSDNDDADNDNDISTKDSYEGTFACDTVCGRPYDCGVHRCQKPCHPQDAFSRPCPLAPEQQTHCPCGRVALADLAPAAVRTSCRDPVPCCDKVCGRALPCGKPCPLVCHAGACPPCEDVVRVRCRCQQTTTEVVCGDATARAALRCDRACGMQMACRAHVCATVCCAARPAAAKRVAAAATKRNRFRHTSIMYRGEPVGPPSVEYGHDVCMRVCNKPLPCGQHRCPDLCHPGSCLSCTVYVRGGDGNITDDATLRCHCGRTTVTPPYPCGTTLPPCDGPCLRRPACGHVLAGQEHRCHDDAQPCVRCPILVPRKCLCGRTWRNNVPCGSSVTIRCELACGKLLKCGQHRCTAGCHAPGQCEDAERDDNRCGQVCRRPRPLCGHPCEEPCHGASNMPPLLPVGLLASTAAPPVACSEREPCQARVEITCSCARRKQTVRCLARRAPAPTKEGAAAAEEEEKTADATADEAVPAAERKLACDDECRRAQRNAVLKAALRIPDDHADDHVPFAAATLAFYGTSAQHRTWADAQEDAVRAFVAGDGSSSNSSSSSGGTATRRSDLTVAVRFRPMPTDKRKFLHLLAADFGLDSSSEDREPHRHVVLYKRAGFVATPMKTLAQAAATLARVRRKAAEEAAAAAVPLLANNTSEGGGGADGDGASPDSSDWLPSSALQRRRRRRQQQQQEEEPRPQPVNAVFIGASGKEEAAAGDRAFLDELDGIVQSWSEQTAVRMAADGAFQAVAVPAGGLLLKVALPPAMQAEAEHLLQFLLSYVQASVSESPEPEPELFLCRVDSNNEVVYRRQGNGDESGESGDDNASSGCVDTSPPAARSSSTSSSEESAASFHSANSTAPQLRKKTGPAARKANTPAAIAAAAAAERLKRMAILAQQPTDEEAEADA